MKALSVSEFNNMFLDATDRLNLGYRGCFVGDALVATKEGYFRLIEFDDGSSRLSVYHGLAEMCGSSNWYVSYAKLKAKEKKAFVESIKAREYEVVTTNSGYRFLQEVGADKMSEDARGVKKEEIASRLKVDIF